MAEIDFIKLRDFHWVCQVISPIITLPETTLRTLDDFKNIFNFLSKHKLLPSFYKSIKCKGLYGIIPNDFLNALEGAYELNQINNNELRNQVRSITKTINDIGITPIWLKGAVNLIEPDWFTSPRTMLDLDVWIPESHAQERVIYALESDGYYIHPDCKHYNDHESHQFLMRIKDGNRAGVEVHRDLVSHNCISLLSNQVAYSDIQNFEWDNLSISLLSPVHQVIQSYIQCTEMNCGGAHSYSVSLMKFYDFITRYLKLNIDDRGVFSIFIEQSRCHYKSRYFFDFIHTYFGIDLLIPTGYF